MNISNVECESQANDLLTSVFSDAPKAKVNPQYDTPDWITNMPIDQLQGYNRSHHIQDSHIRSLIDKELVSRG